jgi:hypothetical protein
MLACAPGQTRGFGFSTELLLTKIFVTYIIRSLINGATPALAGTQPMFSISPDKLRRLEELVHELSNSVGLAAAYLELKQKAGSGESIERFEIALRLTTECRTALASLMWEVGQIRVSAEEVRHDNESIFW